MKKLRSIFLAGGVSSSLWPLSIEDIPLHVIEVQTGSNSREYDIIRLEDSYRIVDLHRFICS
jgi:mannose-1-phosphate guanylyltransferase